MFKPVCRLSDPELELGRYESAPWSDRKVLHLQLDLRDSGMRYEAGDSVGVLPSNSPVLVDSLLERLGHSRQEVISVHAADGSGKPVLIHLPSPCTLGYALTRCVDLTSSTKKSVLRMLAEHCTNPAEKRTLIYIFSKAGKAAYQHDILEHQPSVLDLLNRFPSCSPPLDAVLDALTPMMPRLYSITTSYAEHPNKLQVALRWAEKGGGEFGGCRVMRYKKRYGDRLGIAYALVALLQSILSFGCYCCCFCLQRGALQDAVRRPPGHCQRLAGPPGAAFC